MKFIPYLVFGFYLLFSNCFLDNSSKKTERINGVSFVSPSEKIADSLLKAPKQKVNSNWLCFMPYGFIRKDSCEVEFNHEWQWWGEKSAGIQDMISIAKKNSYKIMLKPQVWISRGEYTGNFTLENEDKWMLLETSYKQYILHFAQIAEVNNLELFCIGTEWKEFISHRPAFWTALILEVKKIFKGKITYASNWDEYKDTPFWGSLDYIGIDAYFPVSNSKTPSVKEVSNSLTKEKLNINSISDSLHMKVIFTEYGFRSMNYCGLKPWESHFSEDINEIAQANCLKAFYETFWSESYVAGGFIWKWFHDYSQAGGPLNAGFTPQNKKAEFIINDFYSIE